MPVPQFADFFGGLAPRPPRAEPSSTALPQSPPSRIWFGGLAPRPPRTERPVVWKRSTALPQSPPSWISSDAVSLASAISVLAAVLSMAPGCGDEVPEPSTEPEATTVSSPPMDDVLSLAENAATESEERVTTFLGAPESALLHALATEDITRIEKGRGGRSLAFRVTLASGVRGYFKPEQSFSAAHFYAELASYYLDRELGLGRVPPTVGRRVEWAPFRRRAGDDQRLEEIVVQPDGTVRGALIAWIEGGLEPISPPEGWTHWLRVRDPLAVSPYQRPREWARDRRDGPRRFQPWRPVIPDVPDRPRELSNLILFDYLTTNVDRWGGRFTNVRTRGSPGPLVYLDNGAGFSAGPTARIPLMDARLEALQRFDLNTVERIRELDTRLLREHMDTDPLSPLLSERHWEQFEERRQYLLAHVERTTDTFGEDEAFAWDGPPGAAP